MSSTHRLSRLTLVLTLVLVTIGGYTRGSGSGYGCADRWPLCENGLLGGLLPRAEYHMVVEWTHRWVAALVGVLAIATAIYAWRLCRQKAVVVVPAVAAVLVIGVQAWLGRMVVQGNLDADLVSVHLAVSMAVVALLTIVVVATREPLHLPTARDLGWTGLLTLAAAGSYVVLLLGSSVHNIYIPGWPLVRNTIVPDLSSRPFAVHTLHRLAAAAVLIYLVYLAISAGARLRPEFERRLLYIAGVAYVVNVGLGAAHVFTRVGSATLVAGHLALASLVWALLVAATANTVLIPEEVRADAPHVDHAS